jgi:eukaryotic-like serine/threonine-protein kinase
MSEDQSRRIGDYEILGVLGSGGMGKVFKVRNVISDRIEAMKVLLPDLAGRQELVDRFLREIKLLASLDHPNIAQLRTALTLSNRLVMVMEYVEGTTLAARLEQGPIPPAEAIGYIKQVLGALAYAHGRNVIHRDIKPANMMLTNGGIVKLMDFGIARTGGDRAMTVTGTTLGSLYYMSPEQVKGGTADARSDLYSLGVSFYEMVTGEPPFKADSDYSLMTAQLQQRPKPPNQLRPELPPQLNGVILHSMAKEPTERFQSADEFRQALDNLAQEAPGLAAAVPIGQPPVSAAAGAAGPVFGGTAALSQATPTQTAPPQATVEIPPPPVSAPAPPPASVLEHSARQSKGRGLYMALGAVIVLVVLVLAGLSFPRWLKTQASEQNKPADQNPSGQNTSQPGNTDQGSTTPSTGGSAPAAQDTSKPADAGTQTPTAAAAGSQSTGGTSSSDASSSGSAGTSASGGTSSETTARGKKASGKKSKSTSSEAVSGSSTANQGTATANGDQGTTSANAAQQTEPLEELEQDVDQTASRASAASDSLDNMRRQMSAQGLSLRGDIASAQELMKTNLQKAQQALQNGDTKNARRYLNMAQAQVDKIEKFLGH